MNAHLVSIVVYPVKACGGISVDAWPVEPRGLRHDRRFMIVRPDGTFTTQRERPELARIATRFDGDALVLAAPGVDPIAVPLAPAGGAPLDVAVWRDRVAARTVSPAVDRWLSAALGEALRLVHFPDDAHRPLDPRYAEGETAFADGYPLLVVGQASLDDLNARLAEPVPMDRFRPNLVVAGAAAFAEDGWREVAVGGVPISIVKPCARCVVVTTDQRTGARSPEPLRTLATYRKVGHDVRFGQNAVPRAAGILRVGDAVVA